MGFAGYFLIVADFIKWAKANDIPVGPGRGSGAGSVVAWSLTITDLDPIALGLLFERFLNPERVSMPDFDIDFCETHRDKVIAYVQRKYGRDKVAQIITFGRLKARAVLKDTGRVLQMPYGQVDRLAKLIPNHPTDPWTLERSLNGVSEVAAEYKDPDVKRLFDLAMKLEGLPRHASTHAAGVVIGDRPLDELVPLYRDPRSDTPVTQFDMKYVEAAGLVKFDFLGLKTLSVLKEGQRLLAEQGVEVDFGALAWDDPTVFDLLQRGDTVGVFQVESEGMRRTLSAVKPTVFEDIIALNALYRPGPMDNIPMFGRRKNGERGDRISAPAPRGTAQAHLRDLRLPGTGHAGGADPRRLFARRRRPAAPRDGQEDPVGDGRAARDLRRGLRGASSDSRGQGERTVRLDRQVRRLRLQQEPRRGLCAADLPDRLAEGAPPRRILCGIDELRPRAHRQAGDVRRGHAPRRNRLPAARHQRERAPLHGRGRRGPLRARSAQGRRREGDGSAGRGAGAGRAFLKPRGFRGADRPAPLNRRQLESLAGAGAFDAIKPERAAVFAGAETILAHAASAHDQRETRAGRAVRRQFGRGGADPPAARRVMDDRPAHGRRARGVRLLFLGPSGRRGEGTCSPRTRSRLSPSSRTFGSQKASESARRWRGWSRTPVGARRRAGAAT